MWFWKVCHSECHVVMLLPPWPEARFQGLGAKIWIFIYMFEIHFLGKIKFEGNCRPLVATACCHHQTRHQLPSFLSISVANESQPWGPLVTHSFTGHFQEACFRRNKRQVVSRKAARKLCIFIFAKHVNISTCLFPISLPCAQLAVCMECTCGRCSLRKFDHRHVACVKIKRQKETIFHIHLMELWLQLFSWIVEIWKHFINL